MTVTVRELNPRTLSVIETAFERTPNPDIWVVEVENFLLGSAARDFVRRRIRNLWLIVNDGVPVGLAANRPHEEWSAELLQAVMIDHRFRGSGLAHPALEALLESIREVIGNGYVMWLVHPDNTAMRHVSWAISGESGTAAPDGYLMFAHP